MDAPTPHITIAPRPLKTKKAPAPKQLTSGVVSNPLLTQKQKKFIEYYLQTGNAYRSAKEAGYAEPTCMVASSVVLKHPLVAREINRRQEEFFRDLGVSTDLVMYEAYKLATANMLDFVEVDEKNGDFKLDLRKVDRDKAAAIQELSYDINGRPRIRLVDKKAAVELFARIKKMLKDEDPVQGKEQEGPLTIKMLDSLVQSATNVQINISHHNHSDRPPLPSSSQVIEAQP